MKCGTKKYAKGGKVARMADGGAVMPSRPSNFSPQGRGMERARFMRSAAPAVNPDMPPVRPDMPTAVARPPMPSQASAGLQRAASQAPSLPSQAVATRPFKKGGMVKKMASGGSVKPRASSGRGVKACKVC